MAIALVQANIYTFLELSYPHVTYASPNTAGNLLIAFTRWDHTPGPISDSAGNTWTLLTGQLGDGGAFWGSGFYVWYAIARSYGTGNIVSMGSFAGLASHNASYGLEFSGWTVPPVGTFATGLNSTLDNNLYSSNPNNFSLVVRAGIPPVHYQALMVQLSSTYAICICNVQSGTGQAFLDVHSNPAPTTPNTWTDLYAGNDDTWSRIYAGPPVPITGAGNIIVSTVNCCCQ